MSDPEMTWRKYLRDLVGEALPAFVICSIGYLASYLSASKAMPIYRTLAVGMFLSMVSCLTLRNLVTSGAKRMNTRFPATFLPFFGYLFVGFTFALGFCIASMFWIGKVSWLLAALGGAILLASIGGGALKVIADFVIQWFNSRRRRRR